jgi:Immunoglobulin I-set domain
MRRRAATEILNFQRVRLFARLSSVFCRRAQIVEEGATVRFQCAIAGHPTPWVTWDKDGLILTPTRRLTIKEKDDLRVVEISDVTLEDAGLYRVTLENDVGRVEASARLDVIGECASQNTNNSALISLYNVLG